MQPISVKDKIRLLKREQKCDRCSKYGVQYHHVFQFAGKQIKEWFNIAFACPDCHAMATPHNSKYKQEVREFFEWNLLRLHLEKFVLNYPKGGWKVFWNYLSKYETKSFGK